MDNPIVYCGVLDEGMNDIQDPFSMDVQAEKVCELLDKEFESAILNDLISF